LETSGKIADEKKEKKAERIDTISSWGEEEVGEEEGTEDDKKEINKKWYKPFYLTNLAMKLNHGANAVKHCDEMITLCDEALNLDQIKIILAANSLYINQLRKSQRGLVKLLMEEKEAKNLIYEIKANKEKAIIERSEKFIKLINEYILSKNTLSKEHQALFLKTKADYYRYLAEVTHDHELFINKQNALHFYMEAKHLTKDLDNLNAIKLDIALNYSVFLNEIMNKRINSYFAAKEAVFNALSDLKNCDETQLGDEQMRDSLICIEILNRNVEEWYNEEMEADNEEAERKKRELVDKANEKNNIDNIEENKKEEEDEDMIKDEDEEEEGLEGILEVGEKEKEDLPLIKDEENKKE
jgi:14-3-3 protein epsilon